jgi:hypothetical protein
LLIPHDDKLSIQGMYEFENGSVPNIQIYSSSIFLVERFYFVIEVVTNDGFQRIENLG